MFNDDWFQQPFVKLGSIKVPNIPENILNAPVETGNTIVAHRHGHLWFKRGYAPLSTYTSEDVDAYVELLDLPPIPYQSSTFMRMESPGLNWHKDSARQAVINIAITNSELYEIVFDNDKKFTMFDGDVYIMDVTQRHKVHLHQPTQKSRVILSINLNNDYQHEETRYIMRSVYDRLTT